MRKHKAVVLSLVIITIIIFSAVNFYYRRTIKTDTSKTNQRIVVEEVINNEKILNKEQMIKDITELVEKLQNVHPKSYNGLTKEQEVIISSVQDRIQGDMRVADFYFLANEIICSFKDAHTHIAMETTIDDLIMDLEMIWLHDGLYVKKNRGSLRIGDKVISIGNRSINEIEKELEKMIPAENIQWLRVRAPGNLVREPFLRHLGLLGENKISVKIERQGEVLVEDVPLMSLSSKVSARANNNNNDWVSFIIDKESSLGIFTLNSCIYNDTYKNTLKEFFLEVAKDNIQNVAVDVRNNTGGNSLVTDEFIKYLSVDKYKGYGGYVRYSKESQEQRPGEPGKGYKSYQNNTIKNNKIEDSGLIFKGNVYVLTSAMTFSSANWFAVIFKDNNIGKVIGEPTGNQPSSYGDILTFKLPESGFIYNISYKRWVRPETKNDPEDCLHPDIEVYTTIEDIIYGRDPVVSELKRIINK